MKIPFIISHLISPILSLDIFLIEFHIFFPTLAQYTFHDSIFHLPFFNSSNMLLDTKNIFSIQQKNIILNILSFFKAFWFNFILLTFLFVNNLYFLWFPISILAKYQTVKTNYSTKFKNQKKNVFEIFTEYATKMISNHNIIQYIIKISRSFIFLI